MGRMGLGGAECAFVCLVLGYLADLGTPYRTLFVGRRGLEQAKQAITSYKTGQTKEMTPELWQAKKIVDSTIHPGMPPFMRMDCCRRHGLTQASSDTGEPVFLPFRMSCFVLSNLVVTVGMLTPGLKVRPQPTQPTRPAPTPLAVPR